MSAVPVPSGRVRPVAVTVAAALLALCIVGNVVGPLLPGSDGALIVGFVLTVIGIVALVGLWLLRKWGYIVTLVVAVLNLLLAIPEMFAGPEAWIKIGGIVYVLACASIIVLVTRPEARRAYA